MRQLICLVLLAASVCAHAELQIQVNQGRNDATPIAVVPFSEPSDAPQDIASIVSADLHRSGLFKPLAPSDLLSRPHRKDQMIWRDFRVLGTDYVVAGNVDSLPSGKYRVKWGLYDVPRQKEVIDQTYEPPASQLRDVAHAISDAVYKHLTGVKGAFETRIVYVTYNKGARYPYELQYADADGARVQTILKSKQPILSPSWSPDGTRIAYVSFENNAEPAIYVHDLATSSRRMVTHFKGLNGAPAWSPDGKKLAVTLSKDGNPDIYSLDLQSGKLTQLTDDYAIDTEACWLPDGKSLVFTSSRSGGPQIYKLNIDDGSVRRLTFQGSYNARPTVTPDGRYLVYVHRENGNFHIAVQDLVRGTFDVVTKTDMDESPSVAPNGSMIIYATEEGGKGVLKAVSMDGRVKVSLPSRQGEVREPAWSPFLQN